MSEQAKNEAAVELGRKGGKVKGACKRRSAEHYLRISQLGVKARIAAQAAQTEKKSAV